MRNLTISIGLLLFAASGLFAQNPDCRDNCGQWTGGCEQCHISNGRTLAWDEYGPVCGNCMFPQSLSAEPTKPKVPLSMHDFDSLITFVEKMSPKPSEKLTRLMLMTPEKHIQVMEAALKARRDGPMLGACTHAFHPGTLAKLPDAIAQTRQRLLTSRLIVLGR